MFEVWDLWRGHCGIVHTGDDWLRVHSWAGNQLVFQLKQEGWKVISPSRYGVRDTVGRSLVVLKRRRWRWLPFVYEYRVMMVKARPAVQPVLQSQEIQECE